MEVKYLETEDDISGTEHGVEFHHSSVTKDTGLFFKGKAIAFLEGYDWLKDKPASVEVLVRAASSPLLAERGRDPRKIIADVKRAVDLFLKNPSQRTQGPVTRYVRTWFR